MNQPQPPATIQPSGPATCAATPPWVRYTDPDWFAREQEAIFRRVWVPVARASELAGPGAYKAVDVGGEAVLLVRDRDGTLRALSNVCRHRFALLKEGTGTAGRIVCPYHAWTFALDGRLVGAPCMEGAEGFDRDALGLPGFAVETWLGWVFVCLASDPPPLAESLAPLEATLDARGIADWTIARRLSYPAPWNWKLMVENFSESYHHLAAHTETLNPFWPAQQTYGVPTNGAYADLRHPEHPEAGSFTVYAVFPTLCFAVLSHAPVAFALDLAIRGPADMTVDMLILAAPEVAADAEQVEAHVAWIDRINQEDFTLLAAMQRGLSSRAARPGPLSPLEQPIALFTAWLDARMSGT
jgi:phenylpropionate dioxygenase-like ring-hydroxylating dioxygenase large terminal subunit